MKNDLRHQLAQSYLNGPRVFIIEFQYNRFTTNFEKLLRVQKEIDLFKKISKENNNSNNSKPSLLNKLFSNSKSEKNKQEKSKTIVLFLGACIHWISMICRTTPDGDEFILLDSENNDYLFIDDSEIEKIIKNKSEKFNWNKWRTTINKQKIFDYQKLIILILKTFKSEFNLMDHMFFQDVKKIFPLFVNHEKTKKYLQTHKHKFMIIQKPDLSYSDEFLKMVKNREVFMHNANPAEYSFMEGKPLNLDSEIKGNLSTLNKNYMKYKNLEKYLSEKTKKELKKVKEDLLIFNSIFKYKSYRFKLK